MQIEERYDALIKSEADEEKREDLIQVAGHEFEELQEEVSLLQTERIRRKAKRWHVNLPEKNWGKLNKDYEDESWDVTKNFGYQVLKQKTKQQLTENIWRKQIEVLVILFGVSSIVQTVFTLTSYFRR
jgi:hypothetical protein